MGNKYLEISNKEYRKKEGISASDLKQMAKSMLHYKYAKDNPQDNDTPSLLFGRASHKMILEPYDFENEFVVAPNVDRRTKAGKEEYEKFLIESYGKDVITQDMFDQLLAMRDALYATPFCKKLIDGEHEKSFFWEEDGLVMKCRPDSFGKIGDRNIVIDYKTTKCAETDAFTRDSIKLNYDVQAAHYCKGLETIYGEPFTFVFVAQEKKPPYACNILEADEMFMQSGKEVREALLNKYKECLETNIYPGYMEDGINSLGVPDWIAKTLSIESEE